ncbi:MAG: Fic family protein [Chloroflexi bacterium]|nr:Fic family protein [Chloroflexota bacterium]
MRAAVVTGDVLPGLRDRGLLESAVMRPRFLAHYLGADLFHQAAALGLGISRSQAFVDGNKRAGQAATWIFLRRNGYRLTVPALELARRLLEVVESTSDAEQGVVCPLGESSEDEESDERVLAAWLRTHTMPV